MKKVLGLFIVAVALFSCNKAKQCYDCKTVVPILLYGSEVWGLENSDIIESVHLTFCKFLLGLKTSTPTNMIYGELGRYPLSVIITV